MTIIKPNNRDFTKVKKSSIEGFGIFAKKIIPKGTRIFEYAGERVSKKKLGSDLLSGLSSLKYIMNLNATTVIDAERNGNNARFINHSCCPNCIVYFFSEIPYIYSLKEIEKGEELSFDYKMGTSKDFLKLSLKQKKEFMPCNCQSANCRGTLLAI